MPTTRLFAAAALALAACTAPGTAPARDTPAAPDAPASGAAGGTMLAGSARLLGRWEKVERSMPPITLELRVDAADRVTGRVWLSGATHEAPAALDDSTFVLGGERPTMRGALTADGTLRVRLLDAAGRTEHEATLWRRD